MRVSSNEIEFERVGETPSGRRRRPFWSQRNARSACFVERKGGVTLLTRAVQIERFLRLQAFRSTEIVLPSPASFRALQTCDSKNGKRARGMSASHRLARLVCKLAFCSSSSPSLSSSSLAIINRIKLHPLRGASLRSAPCSSRHKSQEGPRENP